ncbi:helix-turn-helix domain-containing protein [Luteimicrobium sp. NPDC057192]|uniref:helix-turn-helix domain-containing protein n=1 Tax=Luteimicrobium sp. NPDC057192 TaxID=3346042 RepID=UPI0036428510
MADERVRMWRPADEPRVLLMAGPSTGYAVEPRGEYVVGLVSGSPMRARRGRDRRLVEPGQLVAWDPSAAHSGGPATGSAWSSRVLVVEAGDLADLVGDDHAPTARAGFREPVVTDPGLAAGFRRLHDALRPGRDGAVTRLERDELLASWLRALVTRQSPRRPPTPRAPRDDRALRDALAYLGASPDRNVGLAELAAAAGLDTFRLLRLFRERTGMPPHAFHLAFRVRAARRLLESGSTIAEAAAATGFADQSHLHRQFRRSLGITPGQYVRYLRA